MASVEMSDGDSFEGPVDLEQPEVQSIPAPPPPVDLEQPEATAQIPPAGSGGRMAFLLGMKPEPSSSKGGSAREGLPPVGATGRCRKRGRTPVASSSDGERPVPKKGRQKEKSPIGTSCSSQAPSDSVNDISDDDDDVVEVNAVAAARAATRRLTSDVWLEMKKELVNGEWKGICNYCHKPLSAGSKSGTSHLRDHLKVCTLRQLKLKNLPTPAEWDFAADVVPRLSLFYEITTLFSGRDYVTANVFFPKICEIKMKIRQWTGSTDVIIQIMCENMIEKFDKYWNDIQGLMGMATLLDPRYKRQMLVACYAMLHGIEPISYECNEKVDAVVANLHKLIKEYEVEEDKKQPAADSLSSMPTPAIMSFFHDIVAQQRPAMARVQGEIEHYLADDLVPYVDKFDVLEWWKVAGRRYPTLRKLARDIFAIPVTTVASESAFSMSGRIVNDHRSRLTSKMLEVLMCYQNWLRNKYKDAHMGEGSFWTCLQDTQEENEDAV